MKKFIFSCAAVFFMGLLSGVYAQEGDQSNPAARGNIVVRIFDAGHSWMRSGDLYETDDASVTGINNSLSGIVADRYYPVGSEINYFILDGLALGGSIHYVSTELTNEEKIKIWSLGPSVYYYLNLNSSFLPYISAAYIYSKIKSDLMFDMSFARIPLTAGVTYMFGKYLGAYGQFSYSYNKFSSDTETLKGKMAIFSVGIKAFF